MSRPPPDSTGDVWHWICIPSGRPIFQATSDRAPDGRGCRFFTFLQRIQILLMPASDRIPTLGVEEEYQLVDPTSGILRPECKRVMNNLRAEPEAEIQHELFLNQIEMASPVCQTLDEVRQSLARTRGLLIDSARQTDSALVSAGINPQTLPDRLVTTPKERYWALTEKFQQTARGLLMCGCHVHVAVPDKELGTQVMNLARPWLPLLQALSANSPFWDGIDTGYASYRRELWAQWPLSGAPPHLQDWNDYRRCVEDLVEVGAIKDDTFVYWDIRLPTRLPTIEFRCADAQTRIEETVGFAGLVRALVMQCTHAAERGERGAEIRPSVLKYAVWHAARYGASETSIDPVSREAVPFPQAIERLLEVVTPALHRAGDYDLVAGYLYNIASEGTGADRQRAAAADSADLRGVSEMLIRETAANAIAPSAV